MPLSCIYCINPLHLLFTALLGWTPSGFPLRTCDDNKVESHKSLASVYGGAAISLCSGCCWSTVAVSSCWTQVGFFCFCFFSLREQNPGPTTLDRSAANPDGCRTEEMERRVTRARGPADRRAIVLGYVIPPARRLLFSYGTHVRTTEDARHRPGTFSSRQRK